MEELRPNLIEVSMANERSIRPLGEKDSRHYEEFRREMWPLHPVCGCWENVRAKYLEHPQADSCPGTGLYAFFKKERILGVIGVLPFPITISDKQYPGHILVDWAVLRRFQSFGIAGFLWEKATSIPGAKLGSSGLPDSQDALARRAIRLNSTEAQCILRPIPYWIYRRYFLQNAQQPAPYHIDQIPLGNNFTEYDFEIHNALDEINPSKLTRVHRGAEFWKPHRHRRLETGTLILSFKDDPRNALVLKIDQIGSLGVVHVLELVLHPDSILEVAIAFKELCKRIGAVLVRMIVSDDSSEAFLSALKLRSKRYPSHWWLIRNVESDSDVTFTEWRFTLADRDFHYGRLESFNWRPA